MNAPPQPHERSDSQTTPMPASSGARAHDDSWRRAANTNALGRAWAAATTWAPTDTDARAAADRVERRLHELHPEAVTRVPVRARRRPGPWRSHAPLSRTP